ncbi:MAG: BamA/TamA family outer membrane protein [Winogradskyella sp.]|uniref:BamA/TamA family outer membrane protein n=1 Tax=Winogradskyella sp. TaxID=1883156 RepID=UPI00385A8FA2
MTKLLRFKILVLLITIFFSSVTSVEAQGFKKVKDFFTFYPNKSAVKKDSTRYLSKFILAPIVSYSPETNFGFGTGAKFLFKFNGSGEETRVSNMPISLRYTLNNQFIIFSGFEIFTNQEKWVIEGNIRFQNYPRLFYGLGRDSQEGNEEEYNYYQLLLEPIFLKNMLTRYLFIGTGLRYNQIFNTKTIENGLLNILKPAGFDGSRSVGVEAAALYDSRNIVLNAKRGWYFEFTHGIYDTAFGSTQNFNLTRFDLRHYFDISDKNEDVLAFQFLGRFSSGDTPFNELSLFGGSKILRGYREGRFVDQNLLANQVEYRKQFKNSRLGAVVFAGAGDVSDNISSFKLDDFRFNYGAGLRYMIDKSERLNIRLDWGFGQKSNYLYLGIAEAF